MNRLLSLIAISFLLFLLSFTFLSQTPKREAIKHIKAWYKQHKEGYSITINKDKAKAFFSRPHSYDPTKVDTEIHVEYKGMRIVFAFLKPISEIHWNIEDLQKQFHLVVINDICHDIPVEGWSIFPKTSSSSSNKGVTFTEIANGTLSFTIDWSTYAVHGYSEKSECQKELESSHPSLPESCYIHVRRNLPLHIKGTVNLTK